MIICRTPFRVSFFGGGTDYPDWFQRHGGAVLSVAIDKYCYVSCRELPPFFEHKYRVVYSSMETVKEIESIQHPAVRGVLKYLGLEQGLEIHHDGDLPARSGLGSSSAFTVGLLHSLRALQGRMSAKDDLAREAIHVEQKVICEAVGSQDQIATAYGGFNHIRFHQNGEFQVEPVILYPRQQRELEDHLVLVFTGKSRVASGFAAEQIRNLESRVKELKLIQSMVEDAFNLLRGTAPIAQEFGRMLDETWALKRSLSPMVSSPLIDELYELAKGFGSYGGKLLGAGGGGFMLFVVPPHQQDAFAQRLKNYVTVPVRFDYDGSRIVYYNPNF